MERTIQFSELDLIQRYVANETPGTFIDVGAHIGGFSMRFAGMGWQVHAFEPDPVNYELLKENLAEFSVAKAVQKAVSNVTGDSIVFYQSTEYWGIHSLAPFDDTHTKTINVPVTRLDDYMKANGIDHVDILKVDTEGADKLVLEGFAFNLRKPALVMAEFMDGRSEPHFGYTHHDVVELMTGYGYSCFVAEWAPVVKHSKREGGGGPFTFLSCGPYPVTHQPAWGNLIFVPNEATDTFAKTLHDYMIELNAGIQAVLNKDAGLIDGLSRKAQAQQSRIEVLEAAIAQRDRRRLELEDAISGRDGRIGELEAAVASRDDGLARCKEAVGGRDVRISELDAAVLSRDARISELDAAVASRDRRVAELGSAIVQRDHRAAQLTDRVDILESSVEELGSVKSELQRSELRLEEAIRDWNATKAEAVSLRKELNGARRTVGWLAVVAAVLAIATLALALS